MSSSVQRMRFIPSKLHLGSGGVQVAGDAAGASAAANGQHVSRSAGGSSLSAGAAGSQRRRLLQSGSLAPGLLVRVFDGVYQPFAPSMQARPCFPSPHSFTALRCHISVPNALNTAISLLPSPHMLAGHCQSLSWS